MAATRQKQPSDQTVKRLFRSLKQLAREKGPEYKLPTTRELCAQYGTNMVNVNNALRELEAQELITRRQGSGIYVSHKVNRLRTAVLLDYAFFTVPGNSPFWGMLWGLLAQEAERRSRAFGHESSFHMLLPREKGEAPLPEPLVRSFEMEHIHAVIGIGLRDQVADWLMAHNVPFAAYAGNAPLAARGVSKPVIRVGVEELAKAGCRRVALFVPGEPYRAVTGRDDSLNLFTEALAANGLPYYPELVVDYRHRQSEAPPHPGVRGTHQEEGFNAVMELFGPGAGEPPDSFVSTDDVLTNGAIAALNELGLRLWTDVKVASHMNVGSPMLFHYEDRMIGLATDPWEIVEALYGMIDRAIAEEIVEETIRIEGRLRMPNVLHEAGP